MHSVFKIVSFAWAGFGASFGPVMLLALFWRRSNRYGAVAGMIAGAVMVFLWKYCIADLAPVLKIYELLPAFLFGLLVNVVVSLCTPAPDKEVLEQYDAVKAEKSPLNDPREALRRALQYDAGDPKRIQHLIKVYAFAEMICRWGAFARRAAVRIADSRCTS